MRYTACIKADSGELLWARGEETEWKVLRSALYSRMEEDELAIYWVAEREIHHLVFEDEERRPVLIVCE